jgi:hypothetical protein
MGMLGLDTNGDLGPFMVINGATGTVKKSTNSRFTLNKNRTQTVAECLFRRGIHLYCQTPRHLRKM